MRKHILVLMTAILVLATAAMAADDPFIGTWKLNVAKSKYKPGEAPKNTTLKYMAQQNGFKQVFDGIDAYGKTFHMDYAGKYDGKDYAITGDPTVDTMAITKKDAHTLNIVQRKGSKVISNIKCSVSENGKISTCTTEQDRDSFEFWEKQ